MVIKTMKIYQLIYTAVKHSLTDTALELVNQPGYRVYSCTQGLSKDDINEVMRFCGYRLPKNSDVKYSKVPFDPSVPEKFPKTFRTFKLSSGKYAAVQVVYAGYDWEGEEGNFFAHAFIIDEAEEGFEPEIFYGSKSFRKGLTEEEAGRELVRYLPPVDEPQLYTGLEEKLDTFVTNHKIQMSAVLEQAMPVFTGGEKTHICISAKNAAESDFYVLGLKRLLPRGLADSLGISTNNIFLPTGGQNKIIINGTIAGKNNITAEDIERRTNCVYIDVQRIETDGVKPMKLFEMTMEELHESYENFSISSGRQLQLWLNSYERLTEEGVGDRLRDLYESVGANLFAGRARSLYERINNADMKQVRYEILEVMYEHKELFPEIEDKLAGEFLLEGISCICAGEPRNLERFFKDISKEAALSIYSNVGDIMAKLDTEKLDAKNGTLLLRIFSLIKSGAEIDSWKSFFKDNSQHISDFLEICAKVMINDTVPVTFTAPAIWSFFDTAEVIAYFHSSTDDQLIKKACRKYVLDNKEQPWSRFGIVLQKKRKSAEETERDIMHIRKLLTTVGYVPYQRSTYKDLKFDVMNEMNTNEMPLLLIRLLNSVYIWQGSNGAIAEAEKLAAKTAELILEMKEIEKSCYDFVFPKLGLEILDSPGHYHELIINDETMEPGFWTWFYVGFRKNAGNEVIRLNYERVFKANEHVIAKLPIYQKLKNLL